MSKHILIVDDNEPICGVIRDMLEFQWYDTTITCTGKDTVAFTRQLHPDLILLDVMLDHGIDGRNICKEVKAAHELNNIPIIMVSATHRLKNAVQGYCQPNSFLAKPFDMYDLINSVATHLAMRCRFAYQIKFLIARSKQLFMVKLYSQLGFFLGN